MRRLATALKERINALRQIDFLATLPDEVLLVLSASVIRYQCRPHEIIFEEGALEEHLFFIEAGSVKVFKTDSQGREQIINMLTTGDFFPHVGLLTEGAHYPATAQALEPTVLTALAIPTFKNILLQNPAVAVELIRVMDNELRQLQQRLKDLALEETQVRLLQTLNWLGERIGYRTAEGILFPTQLNRQQLAEMIGTTRETASRLISRLTHDGVLESRPQGLVLRNAWVEPPQEE
ncbi:MAG: Crp/Fnr family transcriptional regulator [Firmicutes bacterium]|nr:Crp/Fnr family transcriptional regulator [Bacillota bacterium]